MRLQPFLPYLNSQRVGHSLDNIVAHFVAAHADVRANHGAKRVRIDVEFFNDPRDRALYNARGRTSPSGVDRGNGPAFSVSNENRNTIGSLYSKNDTTQGGYGRISRDGFARSRRIDHIDNNAGMNLFQLDDRPTWSADGRNETRTIHCDHWIWRIGRTQREVVSFTSPRRKCMDEPGNLIQSLGMKEGDLVLPFYL